MNKGSGNTRPTPDDHLSNEILADESIGSLNRAKTQKSRLKSN